jgi:drug/metabolite transporter (DMT)-like permease
MVRMSRLRILVLTLLAMIAFAGNSLLCRAALQAGHIDAASFTTIRVVAGALALWLIVRFQRGSAAKAGSWPSAFALFAYAAAFSFAYLTLTAATGALLLFGAVQATMIGTAIWRGDRLGGWQLLGVACAFGGLVGLLLPGLSAPPLAGAGLMLLAGIAWGVYSLRGKGAGDPLQATAGNFLRAVPFALALSLAMLPWARSDLGGAHLGHRLRDLVHRAARPQGGERGDGAAQRAAARRDRRRRPPRRAGDAAAARRLGRDPRRHRAGERGEEKQRRLMSAAPRLRP